MSDADLNPASAGEVKLNSSRLHMGVNDVIRSPLAVNPPEIMELPQRIQRTVCHKKAGTRLSDGIIQFARQVGNDQNIHANTRVFGRAQNLEEPRLDSSAIETTSKVEDGNP